MTEPLVCACRTFELPNGYGLYEDGFIHTVDCCPVVRLRDMVPATTPPPTPSDAAMRAAEEIADYVSDGILGMGNEVTETNKAEFLAIITRHLPACDHERVVAALNEARELVSAVSTVGRHNAAKYPKDVRADCVTAVKVVLEKYRAAAIASPETPVGTQKRNEDGELTSTCRHCGQPISQTVSTGSWYHDSGWSRMCTRLNAAPVPDAGDDEGEGELAETRKKATHGATVQCDHCALSTWAVPDTPCIKPGISGEQCDGTLRRIL